MTKYLPKQIITEAFQITHESRKDKTKWPKWLQIAWDVGIVCPSAFGQATLSLRIHAQQVQWINYGTYIVLEKDGSLSLLSPRVFNERYIEVEE